MPMLLNKKAEDHAKELIAAGKVNVEDFPFRFDRTDSQAMLGPEGTDWENFQSMHLGKKPDADTAQAEMGQYDHPIGKDGTVHLAALHAARNNAWSNGDHEIAEAADGLMTNIKSKMDCNQPMLAAAIDVLPEGMMRITAADPEEAQKARSKKYGIAIKDGGHVTKPGEWSGMPDDEFLDPVNYRYPCPDAKQTDAAARYWGKPKDKEQYSSAEQAIINRRLAAMEKKHKVGIAAHAAAEEVILPGMAHITAAIGKPEDPDYGYKWRVQIIEAGTDKAGKLNYPLDVIHAAAPLYEGVKVMALEEGQHSSGNNEFGKSVRDIVGWMSDVTRNKTGNEGQFNILAGAKWLRDNLVDAWERGKQDLYGLSHDAIALLSKGAAPKDVLKIGKVDSVDVVYSPIAGGKFLRVAAAHKAGQEESDMNWKRLLAALKEMRPDLGEKITAAETKGEALTDNEVKELLIAAGAVQGDVMLKIVAAMKDEGTQLGKVTELLNQANEANKAARITAAQVLASQLLTDSKLPEITQKRIRKSFEGQIVDEARITASIKEAKDEIDHITSSGAPVGQGDVRYVVGQPERIQAAMDLMMRIPKAKLDPKLQDQAAFDSIKAAYVFLTGDTNVSGMADRATMQRITGAFDSSTFAYVLGNTLYRKMVNDYKEADDYGVDLLVGSNIRNAKDFRTLESVRVSYMDDLPDVNPENTAYPDLGVLADEEIAYALNQKGGIITITRKMIINDDMQLVNRIISRLPRTARKTHARRAWNILINNSNYGADGQAIFCANHNNLGSAAYAYDSAYAAVEAMMKQSEPTQNGNNLRLGLKPKTLSVPAELWHVSSQVNKTPGIPGTNNFGNPMYLYFGEKNERIFINPFMTDVNDWIMTGDTDDADILEAAYLNGQREPEMFVANLPTAGQTFYQDQIQYKVRHEYEFACIDYRNVYKAQVA